MKIIDILIFNRELLMRLKAAGIRLDDAAYVSLYDDYRRMRDRGDKVTYAVAVLAARYGISERKVYSLLRRFQADCGQRLGGGKTHGTCG